LLQHRKILRKFKPLHRLLKQTKLVPLYQVNKNFELKKILFKFFNFFQVNPKKENEKENKDDEKSIKNNRD
jgi:hypothetical protein